MVHSWEEAYEVSGDSALALELLTKSMGSKQQGHGQGRQQGTQAANARGGGVGGGQPSKVDMAVQIYNRGILSKMKAMSSTSSTTASQQQRRRPRSTANSSNGGQDINKYLSDLERIVRMATQDPDSSSKPAAASSTSSSSSSIAFRHSKKRQRHLDWVMSYNRALSLLATGRAPETIELLWSKLEPLVHNNNAAGPGNAKKNTPDNHGKEKKKQLPPQILHVACRMVFLLFEAILAWNVTSPPQEVWEVASKSDSSVPTLSPSSEPPGGGGGATAEGKPSSFRLNVVLQWLQNNITEDDPSARFLLSLYRSRLDFEQRDPLGKLMDAKIRSARKELKQAMEIFQHKLRVAATATATTATGGDGNSSLASNNSVSSPLQQTQQQNQHHQRDQSQTQPPPAQQLQQQHQQQQHESLTSILQLKNQAALNLKANTEQLKGNMKKSLILLSEAAQATNASAAPSNSIVEPDKEGESLSASAAASIRAQDYYEPFHQNNLAIVYATNGKPHLALHAWSKAIHKTATPTEFPEEDSKGNDNSGKEQESPRKEQHLGEALWPADGTARPAVTLHIFYNAAIGSLKVHNFLAAYECLGLCLGHLPWVQKPKCWLRLAEACIGISAQKKKESQDARFAKIEFDGRKVTGIVMRNSSSLQRTKTPAKIDLESLTLASPEDLEHVRSAPLSRARFALEQAIQLYDARYQQHKQQVEIFGLSSARLSLAYVCLEEGDYHQALDHANWVLDQPTSTANDMDSIRQTVLKKQHATARMYAAEAAANVGDAMASMHFMIGDGKDDVFDRLASDLAGVTIGTAASNPAGKARLAKAQVMVRCSASVASACVGNVPGAKQLAMRAQAMEGACSPSIRGDASLARQVLVYCMLKEGNTGGAVTLLSSGR